MQNVTNSNQARKSGSPDYDIVIVGASLSGIDAGSHLRRRHPDKRFAIFERAQTFGGTWRIHTYPGIRSDSEMHNYGYSWKPWVGHSFARADEILDYFGETIEEEGLAPHIQYGQALVAADWSDAEQIWHLSFADEKGHQMIVSAAFLWMCAGYYDMECGHEPELPGRDRFPGEVIHPQRWPEGEVLSDQRVAIIGSGASAATLAPALSETSEHITIVQRSPTYFAAKPMNHELAAALEPLNLPEQMVHDIMRLRFNTDGAEFRHLCKIDPERAKAEMVAAAQEQLGDSLNADPHFSPSYYPGEQRVAIVPDGDLFRCIREGSVSVVTGHIDTLTETGLLMQDGTEVEADTIVSATGLRMTFLAEVPFSRNGENIDFTRSITWRGIMATQAPNMAWMSGYLRTSWTLRADLICDLICRLIDHMDSIDVKVVEPILRKQEEGMDVQLWVEGKDFSAGYIGRAMEMYPRQGDHDPWTVPNSYEIEKETLPRADLADGTLDYR